MTPGTGSGPAEPLDWRAVFALLANPDTRTVFAEASGELSLTGVARERALAKLVAAGLLEKGPDGRVAVSEARLRASLSQAAPARASGAERFLSRDGRLLDYPSRWSDRLALLGLIAERCVGPQESLTERQLGERLARVADDVATLRRYLVDAGALDRSPDGRSYRRAAAGTGDPGTGDPGTGGR